MTSLWIAIILHLLSCGRYANASWWLLAMPSANVMLKQMTPIDYKHQCHRMEYLVARQRELCALSENLIVVVSQGARLAMEECQTKFSQRRWNCSTQLDRAAVSHGAANPSTSDLFARNRDGSGPAGRMLADIPLPTASGGFNVADVFGEILDFQSREKAYVHAVSAAGVAYSITRACREGKLPTCKCDPNVQRKYDSKGRWEWGGCSDHVSYGERISKEFVDSSELVTWKEPAARLMNLHNNEVGRRALRKNLEVMCKCHGVSGSCTLKICWRQMQEFSQIAEMLQRKSDYARKVAFIRKKRGYRLKPLQFGSEKRASKKDLVYLQESPNYCVENSKLGIPGTRGRVCNASSYGLDSCTVMCCGRGYTRSEIEKSRECRCKFIWCCSVKCERCRERVIEHRCK